MKCILIIFPFLYSLQHLLVPPFLNAPIYVGHPLECSWSTRGTVLKLTLIPSDPVLVRILH